MTIIKINDYISNAVSNTSALKLRKIIDKYLLESDKIVLDFEGVKQFTCNFFNVSIGYYVSLLSPNIYDKRINIINLSELGKSVYNSSYDNAVNKYIK